MKIATGSGRQPRPLLAQSAEQLEFFEKKIRPIFATKCYALSRRRKTQMAGINLSVGEGFAQGGREGRRRAKPPVPGNRLRGEDQDAADGKAAGSGDRRPEILDRDGRAVAQGCGAESTTVAPSRIAEGSNSGPSSR